MNQLINHIETKINKKYEISKNGNEKYIKLFK